MGNFWSFIFENLLGMLMNVASLASSLVSIVVNVKTGNKKKYIKIVLIISLVIFVSSSIFLAVQYQSRTEDSGTKTELAGDTTTQNHPVINDEETTTSQPIETTESEDEITTANTNRPTTTKPIVIIENDSGNNSGNFNNNEGGGTIEDNDIAVSGNQNTVVINPQPSNETKITVSKVTISDKSITLKLGETKKIKATVIYSDNSKDENVIWTSSNENVATVDEDGNITAISSGAVEIIAHASKNNTTMQEVCSVKVSAPPSGYQIGLSSETIPIASNFKVYITPYESDVDKIMIYGKSPSGKIFEFELQDKGYEIYEEPGEWTIYAKIKNDAGEYVASKPEDYAKLQVEPIDVDSILNGMIKT